MTRPIPLRAHCPRCGIDFTYGHTGMPFQELLEACPECPQCHEIQRVQGIYEYPVQPKEKP